MTVTAKLHSRNIRMASDLQEDGMFGFYPHDLLTFGSAGATIAATTGKGRYAWAISADHPSGGEGYDYSGGYFGGADFLIGYSNDPGCPPETWAVMIPAQYAGQDDARSPSDRVSYYHYNQLFYNPDDATYPFYLNAEMYWSSGGPVGRTDHEGGLLKSADLVTWVGAGGIFIAANITGNVNQYTGFNRVKRLSSSSWESVGRGANSGTNVARWTASAAGGTWTSNGTGLTRELTSPTRAFGDPFGKELSFNVAGQDYMLMTEDTRVSGDGLTGDGQFVSLVPVDSGYNVLATPDPIRLTPGYDGMFPSFSYLQVASFYIESGILHFWAYLGYFSDVQNPHAGQHEASADYYSAVIDATAANTAAPVGVRVECHMGCVVVSWYDALSHQNYRVYKSTDGGSTYPTSVDVTGLQYVEAAGAVNATCHYKVVTRYSAADQGERIVHTYVSNARREANRHVTRVLDAGATNINVAYVDRVVTILRDMDLTDNLMHWDDPKMGVIKDGGNVVSAVYCLGSTLKTFGGDWRAQDDVVQTGLSSYDATTFGGNPGIVGASGSAHGYFNKDRYAPFRRKVKTSWGAAYKKPGSGKVNFFAIEEFGGIVLYHESGTPGTIDFRATESGYDVHASAVASSATGPHVAIGVIEGEGLTVYADGVVGTPATGIPNTILLNGQYADTMFLGTGSANLKITQSNAISRSLNNKTWSDAHGNYTWSTLFVFDTDLSASQAKILSDFLTADMAGATYTLPSYATPFLKDIVADYSAAGDGTTDDSTHFTNFRDAAVTWQATNTGLAVLKVPAGEYLFKTSPGLFKGIKNLLVIGADRDTVSFTDDNNPLWGFFMGNAAVGWGHVNFNTSPYAKLNTVAAGSSSIQCVTAGDRTAFTVGQKILVSGIAVEGDGGQPPAFGFYEWPIVTSIDVDGTLHLDRPLEYGYKSTWPSYAAGGDPYGGPATAWPLDSGWEGEHEYRNLTTTQLQNQTKAPKQYLTLNNCNLTGPGLFPTEAEVFEYRDCTIPDISIEIDKIVGSIRVNSGVFHGMTFQTPALKFTAKRGAIFDSGGLQAGGYKTVIDGIYSGYGTSFSPTAFGNVKEIIALNSTLANVAMLGANESNVEALGYTMSGGVIRINKANRASTTGTAIQWATPGSKILFGGLSLSATNAATVTDIAVSGSDLIVTTDRTGGFPHTPVSIKAHPAEKFTMRGVCDPILTATVGSYGDCQGWSYAQAFKPMYAQTVKRYYGKVSAGGLNIGTGTINQARTFLVFGGLGTITIAVTTAYDGATTPLLWQPLGQFGGHYVKRNGTTAFWNPVVDLRQAGTRVITSSGVTGALGSDSLTPPADLGWISDTMLPYLATDITNEGAFLAVTLTFQLDQSAFGGVFVVPLRLRLRAP